MKSTKKLLALMLGSVFAVSALAACTPSTPDDGPDDGPSDNTGTGSAAAVYQICYDNVGGGYVDEAYTSVALENITLVEAYNAEGRRVSDISTIATYEEGVVRGVSAGTLIYEDVNENVGRIEIVPAYVTDPGDAFYYSGTASDFNEGSYNTVLGHTHDPSLIEVTDSTGLPIYYIFSTGWADRTNDGTISTYGNAIHVSYDGMKTWEFLGRTFDYETRDEDFINTRSGAWLYREGVDSTTTGELSTVAGDNEYSENSASWWAPDIVAKPDGSGYWLYTCVVDGSGDHSGIVADPALPNYRYARACILLYESDSLEPGSFKPVLDENGDPAVLMQSTILRGESVRDVNGIDPQIIFDPDGNMYMAYGSFGSGNYMIELDPETGLRKDGMGWQSHADIRNWVENDIQALYRGDDVEGAHEEDGKSIGWTHSYYGTNLSKANMEAPVLARHDNVTIMDEDENILEEGKTYYYTMHSYDGLADNYQMWGGRSESVWGVYKSTTGGIVYNAGYDPDTGIGSGANEGNKYMGAFTWHSKSAGNNELDIILPGHNDLFTTSAGTSVAAYITRQDGNTGSFVTQIHQYYLNSYGEIVINPNRYAGESSRAVSAEELFAYTDGGKFKMVVMTNNRDTTSGFNSVNVSRDVTLEQSADDPSSGAIYDGPTTASTQIGTWKMYGNGYIKFTFTETLKGSDNRDSGETVYYGVVRNAWLGDQHKSGFTITCLGQTEGNVRSMSMFMNNYSTLDGEGLVAE